MAGPDTAATAALRSYTSPVHPVYIGFLDILGDPIRVTTAPYNITFGGGLRTNLLRYSEQFENAAWLYLTNATITPNSVVAPDSTTTADTLVRSAAGNHFIGQPVIGTFASQTMTFSVWLKAGTLAGNVVLRIRDGASNEYGNSVVTPSSTWTRYSATGVFPSGAAADCYLYIDPNNDAGSAGETLHMWGAQIETGATPTAYIPTTSVAVTVTDPGATGDAELDGLTFSAVDPEFISVSQIVMKEGGTESVTCTLSGLIGVDSGLLNQIGDKANWQGRVARLWQMQIDESLAQVGAIWPWFTGYMTVPRITGDKTRQVIELEVESYLSFLRTASGRTYLSQGDFDSGDLSAQASIAAANGQTAAGAAVAVASAASVYGYRGSTGRPTIL